MRSAPAEWRPWWASLRRPVGGRSTRTAQASSAAAAPLTIRATATASRACRSTPHRSWPPPADTGRPPTSRRPRRGAGRCWSRRPAPRPGSSTRTTTRPAPSRSAAGSTSPPGCSTSSRSAAWSPRSRGNHGQSLAFAGSTRGVPVIDRGPPRATRPTRTPRPRRTAPSSSSTAATSRRRSSTPAVLADRARPGRRCRRSTRGWSRASRRTPPSCTRRSPGLDVVYVPVGMGSGICANIAVRDLLGRGHRGRRRRRPSARRRTPVLRGRRAGRRRRPPTRFVDGVACRTPDPEAVGRSSAPARPGSVRVSEEQAARRDGADVPRHPQPGRARRVAGPARGLLAERGAGAGRTASPSCTPAATPTSTSWRAERLARWAARPRPVLGWRACDIGAHVDQTDPHRRGAGARGAALVQFFLGDPQGYQGPEIRVRRRRRGARPTPRRRGSTSTCTRRTSSTSPPRTTGSGSRAASCSSSTSTPRPRSAPRA